MPLFPGDTPERQGKAALVDPGRFQFDHPHPPAPAPRQSLASTQDDGWAFLGAIGIAERQLDPAFDPRSYGFKQRSQMIEPRPDRFVVREDRTSGGPSLVYVQMKSQSRLRCLACFGVGVASGHLRNRARDSRSSWPIDRNIDRTRLSADRAVASPVRRRHRA